MDLEELKNTWMALDEQLKKNEVLNKQIVREMLYKKSNKSLNWLVNMEFMGTILLLFTIPLCFWLYNAPIYKNITAPKILFLVAIIFAILGVIWYFYKILKYLLRIDFSMNIKDNIQSVNEYAILIKKEKFVSYFIVIPVLSLLGIWGYYELHANLLLWILLTVALIFATLMTYWLYKKIYDANIQSIKKSLEELEELKEE
ncbi:MAG: hypothetical protein FWF52_05755 [Candidatus Azobacteroides sp.]|nr:hypothetical protein [Candidatus Azobacteroides sp.]